MKFLNPKTQFNVSPYFDDYSEGKGFVSILYRPGTVQTRELNQMQTIIQDQIARFGRNVFQEGSIVIPGGISFKEKQAYVKINITSTDYNSIAGLDIDTLWIRSSSTGLTAKIIKLMPATGTDPVSAFVEYIDSGDTTVERQFSAPEPLYIVDRTTNVSLVNCSALEVGFGQYAILSEGVYFIRGYFVHTEGQDIAVAKYNTTSTTRVGFKVSESIITEAQDSSLYSNATGEPNFKAPGAHRFKIDLEDALVYLVIQVRAIGLSPAIRNRLDKPNFRDSAFFALVRGLEEFVNAYHAGDRNLTLEKASRFRMIVWECRRELAQVHKHLDEYGR